MEEFVFAAFISEGKVRIGRAASLAKRIALLRSELNAYGADIHSLLITSPTFEADKIEKDILLAMPMRFDRVSRKTFLYSDKNDVAEVFHDYRLEFIHVNDVKVLKVGKNYKICAVLNYQDYEDVASAKEEAKKNLPAKILNLMARNGGEIKHGILHNRLRTVPGEDLRIAVDELIKDGLISSSSSIHKFNKQVIKTYKLRG